MKPIDWLDQLKQINPELYREAIDLVAEGLITFTADGRMVGADGTVLTLKELR